MNRDKALTETAMEVSPQQWGEDSTIHYREFEFGWNEYQQRRAELINEPDDADAPEWARWKAQDGDGDWFWFKFKPERGSDQWGFDCGLDSHCFANDGDCPSGHDWTKTLREVNRDMSQNKPVNSRNEQLARDMRITVCTPEEDEEFDRIMRQQCADKINPSHYRKGDVECIDALKAATVGKAGIEAVCVANVIKYLWRYEEKNGVEDVEKALWYLNRLHDELHG